MITDFRLKVFKTVADRLSFTRAAAELFISQPAVTRHINELEKQTGERLFLRQGNAISLTDKGRLLLDHANRILSLYQQLDDAFAAGSGVYRGEIALGASTTISQYVLPPVLARFKARYPEIGISLYNGNTRQIERMVYEGRLDFGLIEGNATDRSLHYEPFMQDELVLVTSTAHTAWQREEIEPEALKTLPLVIREDGSGTLEVVERALAAHGIGRQDLDIRMQLGSTESIKHYLYASDCFAFVSVQAVLDELAANRLKVVEVSGMPVTRLFRFVTAHGDTGRLNGLFRDFCRRADNRLL